MDRFLAGKLGVVLLATLPIVASAQDSAADPAVEPNLYLSCIAASDQVVSVTIAINADLKRARIRQHREGGWPRLGYGVIYKPTHIHLYPNRLPPNPPPMRFDIDRETLVLTFWKGTHPWTGERTVIGTANCSVTEPEPDLMPGGRRRS